MSSLRNVLLISSLLVLQSGLLAEHVSAQTVFTDRFELQVSEPGPEDGTGWLAGLTLSGTQATPFGYLLVGGLPDEASVQGLYAVFDGSDITLVELADDGTSVGLLLRHEGLVYLPIPFVEEEGSQTSVIITDGQARSPTFLIDIASLPEPRPGAADDALDAAEDLIKALTEFHGLSYPEEWIHWRDTDLEGMPLRLLPIMEIWDITLNDQNPNSIIANQDDQEGLEILERILNAGSTIESLLNLAAFFSLGEDQLPRPIGPIGGATENVSGYSPWAGTDLNLRRSSPGAPVLRVAGEGSINSPDELAALLEIYQTVRQLERDLELLDDIFLSHIATFASIASIKVSGGASAIAISAARVKAIEGALRFFKTIHGAAEIAQWFLPCCLSEMEVILAPNHGVIWFEDAQPNQIQLLAATVTAESEGVNFAQKFAERIAGIYGDMFSDELIKPQVVNLLDEIASEGVGDLGFSARISSLISQQLGDLPVVVFEWTGVDVMGNEAQKWLRHEISTPDGQGSPIIEHAATAPDKFEFRLRTPQAFDRDTSTLRFLTDIDELPARNTALKTTVIELKRMFIRFDRPRIRLQREDFTSGEPIDLEVTVDHTVLWDSDLEMALDVYLDPEFPTFVMGQIELLPGSCEENTCTIRYWPGNDEGEFPSDGVLIKVDYVGDSGIFSSPQAPIRRGINSIVYNRADLIIEPDNVCIQAGTTQQFTARDGDTEELIPSGQIHWTASTGTISSSGLFTAPGSGSGVVNITAALVADPETNGSSTVLFFEQCEDSFFDLSGQINAREFTPETVFLDFSQDIWILAMAGPNYLLQFESNFFRPVTGGSYLVNDSFEEGTFNATLFSQREDGDGGADLEVDIESGVIQFSNVTPTVAVGTFDLRAESNTLRIQGVFLAEPPDP